MYAVLSNVFTPTFLILKVKVLLFFIKDAKNYKNQFNLSC